MASIRSSLSEPLTWVALAISFVVYNIVVLIINHRKFRHIKGPALASVSRPWILWQEISACHPQAQLAALRKYGIHIDSLVDHVNEILKCRPRIAVPCCS